MLPAGLSPNDAEVVTSISGGILALHSLHKNMYFLIKASYSNSVVHLLYVSSDCKTVFSKSMENFK